MSARVIRQIFQLLNYVHSYLFVHRDLKPENFLFLNKDEGSPIKAIDFGLARILKSREPKHKLKSSAGTPNYMAPEVLDKSGYDMGADCWSAGIMLYVFLCGYTPFYGDDKAKVQEIVSEWQNHFTFEPEDWGHISSGAKDLVTKLITHDHMRLTAAEALEHPWIKQHTTRPRNVELLQTLDL